MATVRDVLMSKDPTVHTISRAASVLEATQAMNRHQIGAMPVLDESGRMVGMFTERDVLRRLVAERRDAASTSVAEIMSTDVIGCCDGDPLDAARSIMKDRRVRHLPVTDRAGTLVGMISIGDLNAWCLEDDEITIQYMTEYIRGRA